MSDTHTPGPWVSNPRGDIVEQGDGAFDDERDFAKLIAYVERKCDAPLIAAAPEMLAELERLAAYLMDRDDVAVHATLAIIKRAKGGAT